MGMLGKGFPCVPILLVRLLAGDAENVAELVGEAFFLEIDRDVIDALYVRRGHHSVRRHVAEEREFFLALYVEARRSAGDHDVGLDAGSVQGSHGVLGRLGLHLSDRARRRQIGNHDERHVFRALELHHAASLEEEHVLILADGAADLDDHDVRLGLLPRFLDAMDDFHRDMRHHFHALAAVFEIALPLDDPLIDAAGSHIVHAGEVEIQEALIVAHVLVALVAVAQNKNLTVLGGVHSACVDVDVGIDLDSGNIESAILEDEAERGGCYAFPYSGNDASHYEYVFRFLLGHSDDSVTGDVPLYHSRSSVQVFPDGEEGREHAEEHAGDEDDEHDLEKVRDIVLVEVEAEESRHVVAEPGGHGPEDEQGDDRGDGPVDHALDEERAADAHLGCPHEAHDADLFLGDEDGQADGVEGDDDGNDDQEERQQVAEAVGPGDDRVEALDDELVLVIIDLVDDGGRTEHHGIVGFHEICDALVLRHFLGLDVQVGAERVLPYLVEGLDGRIVVRMPLSEQVEGLVGAGIGDARHLGQLLERALQGHDLVLGGADVEVDGDVDLVLDLVEREVQHRLQEDDGGDDEERDGDHEHRRPRGDAAPAEVDET